MASLNFAFFGSSLVSAYWNGAATYYRGIVRALSERGHIVTFYEPDAFERQLHRDLADPHWARSVVYPATEEAALRCVDQARQADVVIKASGIGVLDALLEEAVLELQGAGRLVAYWDVDAPATLERVESDANDRFRSLIPRYDLILTYGGGEPVVRAYQALGARSCTPIYNALDPREHYPTAADARFAGDLAFLGNRLPDREARADELFFRAASFSPEARFVLGGSGWQERPLPRNVHSVGHVYTRDHNAFNCTPTAILNVSRQSMARIGFSPATRVFEAAGSGACIITDPWQGLELFLEPGREVLVAASGAEVAEQLAALTPKKARSVGGRARARILFEHTYAHRVELLECAFAGNGAVAPK